MNTSTVTMVRIYLTEGEGQLSSLLKRLRDWEKIRGVTVFRGISGYGESGIFHGNNVLDLTLNMPIVIEFFDVPDKVETILEHLDTFISPGHIVTWQAEVNQ